jgi:two-component system response regulator CpxR
VTRILLIEDEEDLADLLGQLLELQGYEVEVAYEGRAGLAKIRSQDFDLVITDLTMPVVSGWEVLEELRDSPEHSAIPVIVTSAGEARDKAKTYGHLFVAKPFGLNQMLAAIGTLVGPPSP